KPDPDVREVDSRNMRVPVMVASEHRAALQHLHLFASADEGKTWERVGTISPNADSFFFCAPKDGLYWLVIQTVGRDGKAHPSDVNGRVRPQIKVLVNTGNGEKAQDADETNRGSKRDTRPLDAANEAWALRMKDFKNGRG